MYTEVSKRVIIGTEEVCFCSHLNVIVKSLLYSAHPLYVII